MLKGQVLLPGDTISQSQIPLAKKHRTYFGLKQNSDTQDYTSTVGGRLEFDHKKRNAQISTPTARYIPKAGDLVIAQVRGSSTDFFHLHINSFSPQAFLPQLAFEGASKKTRPQLKVNDLVYAKVIFAQNNMEVELSCVNPSTGKAEPDGLGPLNGGMVFPVSPGLADRLLKKQGVTMLDELGNRMPGGFEIAVGKNGQVWVDCPDAGIRGICAIGRCLTEIDDANLQDREQKKLVKKISNVMGLG